MAMDHSSATFSLPLWTITVHGMPSCKGCLIAGPHHRLDISFTAIGDAPVIGPPHGIMIGQSFATPGVARNGSVELSTRGRASSPRGERTGRGRDRRHGGALRVGELPLDPVCAFSRFDAPAKAPPSFLSGQAIDRRGQRRLSEREATTIANPPATAQRI